MSRTPVFQPALSGRNNIGLGRVAARDYVMNVPRALPWAAPLGQRTKAQEMRNWRLSAPPTGILTAHSRSTFATAEVGRVGFAPKGLNKSALGNALGKRQ
jgi:hypothetical protein